MKLFAATILVSIIVSSWKLGAAAPDFLGLPWSELKERVDDQLIDTSAQDYVDQCYPEFMKPVEAWPGDRDSHNLIDQRSGLCMTNLLTGLSPTLLDVMPMTSFVEDQESGFQKSMDPANPAFDIPSKVLFPRNAGDVVAAVDFAKTHSVELSVKNSGHSYSGKSMKANTLLVNMNQYVRYAYDDEEMHGIVECTGTSEDTSGTRSNVVNDDLSNQACRLAIARGKSAFIRVGGGENFDKLYRSVKMFNEKQEEYKYHVVGGSDGTVSPMGWTFEGGLAPTMGGRLYGFGLDQVLQIEAVLPNGEHVRFGPTSWEDAEGYMFPKTTKVSGVCNKNPEDEEVDWVWGPCPEATDELFDDLWFAFRGGGGGLPPAELFRVRRGGNFGFIASGAGSLAAALAV